MEEKTTIGVQVDKGLKMVAAEKAKKYGVSLSAVIRYYLGYWVNMEDERPVIIGRDQYNKLSER